jgi:hypothetical protein
MPKKEGHTLRWDRVRIGELKETAGDMENLQIDHNRLGSGLLNIG